MRALLVILCFVSSATFAAAPLGFDSIRLPEGYTFKHNMGTDSYVGTIRKDGGLVISVDSGLGVTPLQPNKSQYRWFREIQLGGSRAHLAMGGADAKKVLFLLFPSVGVIFIAEVHSEADIAEFIAILSTYVPSDE
jgi:hypothetical protein